LAAFAIPGPALRRPANGAAAENSGRLLLPQAAASCISPGGQPKNWLFSTGLHHKGKTDCHTSDIGHWFAMTRVGHFPVSFGRD
ncbi:MAG: hypothetical protein II885_11990, partial [Oscillospiraceae bacterium]|nr:hypothetical protein [Oscillospiraceae bacterium]